MEIIAPVAIADAGVSPFGRASTGTYWDRKGLLQTAAADTLRVTYDPADLSAAPYPLIEPAATNLFLNSSDLTKMTLGQFMNYNGQVDGPGGTVGFRFTSSGVGNSFVLETATLSAGVTYAFQYWLRLVSGVKQGSFYVRDDANGGIPFAVGVSEITDWQPVSVVFTVGAASGKVSLHVGAVDAPAGYAFDVAMPMLVANALQVGSYIATGGSPVTRAADVLAPGAYGLVQSNIAETDANDGPLWVQQAYTKGTTVRRPNHRRFYALQDVPATVTAPENNTAGQTPYWQDIGPTERFAVFDNKYSTYADAPEAITYVLRPGSICTALAALGIEGSDARVSVVDVKSGFLVYQRTKNLRIKNCTSLLDYCFKPIMRRRDEVFDDLPRFKDALVCLTITKPGSTAQLADVVVGRLEYVGEAQWEPEIRTLRRSIIDDDGFGAIKFTKRRSSKLLTVSVRVDNTLADNVVRIMDEYTDEPCVIVVDSRWTSLIILGFVQDFSFVLKSPAGSLYNAQAQGFA